MFSESNQKGGCWEGSGREFFFFEVGSMHIRLGFFGALVGVEEMRVSVNF